MPASRNPSATAHPACRTRGIRRPATTRNATVAMIASTTVKPSPMLNAAPGFQVSCRVRRPPSSTGGFCGSRDASASVFVAWSAITPTTPRE